MRERMTDFPCLQRTLTESRLWQAGVWALACMQAAWNDSRAAGRVRAAGCAIQALPPDERLRAVALAMGFAAAGYLALLAITPPYVAPALPRVWIAGGSLLAFLVAAGARAVARAWGESKIAALVRAIFA